MNKILKQYLRDLERHLTNIRVSHRQPILDETRAHLESRVKDLQAEQPHLSEDERYLHATYAFGPAEELAVAYEGDDVILRSSPGKDAVDLLWVSARSLGRGTVAATKTTGKILGTTAGVILALGVLILVMIVGLLAIALIVAPQLGEAFEDEINLATPTAIYDYSISEHDLPGKTDVVIHSFEITEDFLQARGDVYVNTNMGCANVQFVSPSGTTYDGPSTTCDEEGFILQMTERGVWQIRYNVALFQGSVHVKVLGARSA